MRNGESRIHAVDGETACQRAVKWRFFRFGYKLTTWSQSLGGLQPRVFEIREAEIEHPEKYLFTVLIIAYRREFVKFETVLRIADVPLVPPLIASEMRVDRMTAGRFGYRRLQNCSTRFCSLQKHYFFAFCSNSNIGFLFIISHRQSSHQLKRLHQYYSVFQKNRTYLF